MTLCPDFSFRSAVVRCALVSRRLLEGAARRPKNINDNCFVWWDTCVEYAPACVSRPDISFRSAVVRCAPVSRRWLGGAARRPKNLNDHGFVCWNTCVEYAPAHI